ncbi:hypothetical protein DSECCO2_408530 [anaerobic digester metagenome]
MPFPKVLGLHNIPDALPGFKALPLAVEPLDNLLYFFHRPVVGAVVHDDHFQLIDRIILIDTADDCFLNPLLLVEAGDDNCNAGRKVHVDRHRPVDAAKEIPAEQKTRRQNTVKIKYFVKLKIKNAFGAHQNNKSDNKKQKQTGNRQRVLIFVLDRIAAQIALELNAAVIDALLIGEGPDDSCADVNPHLIAFRHRSGLNAEFQPDDVGLTQGFKLRLAGEPKQHPG